MRKLLVIKHIGKNRIVVSYDMDSKDVEVMVNGEKTKTTWTNRGRNLVLDNLIFCKSLIPLGFKNAKDVKKSLELTRGRFDLEDATKEISDLRENVSKKVLLLENNIRIVKLLADLHNEDLLIRDALERRLKEKMEGLHESIHSHVKSQDYDNTVKISCAFENIMYPFISIKFTHNDNQAKIGVMRIDPVTDELTIQGVGRAKATEIHNLHAIIGAGYLTTMLFKGWLDKLFNELYEMNKKTYESYLSPMANLYHELTIVAEENKIALAEAKEEAVLQGAVKHLVQMLSTGKTKKGKRNK